MVTAAAVRLGPTLGDPAGNLALTLAAIEEAAAMGARLIVLPELATSGYSFESPDEARGLAETIPGPASSAWAAAAARHGVVVVGGICEIDAEGTSPELRSGHRCRWLAPLRLSQDSPLGDRERRSSPKERSHRRSSRRPSVDSASASVTTSGFPSSHARSCSVALRSSPIRATRASPRGRRRSRTSRSSSHRDGTSQPCQRRRRRPLPDRARQPVARRGARDRRGGQWSSPVLRPGTGPRSRRERSMWHGQTTRAGARSTTSWPIGGRRPTGTSRRRRAFALAGTPVVEERLAPSCPGVPDLRDGEERSMTSIGTPQLPDLQPSDVASTAGPDRGRSRM